ncbi:MAG: family 43 glycosylhydrolase [Candidatus Symbiothrix sp.]|jgi:beta-xylosidase|nr:family 43 glycosylhydrolase [Candidatus Symbiothrix sp.]
MSTRIGLLFFLAMFFALGAYAQQLAENPFIRTYPNGDTLYTADPSAHVWADGRLYVYASQDIVPPRGCDLMDRYHVFSTDDMIRWKDHGQILEARNLSWGRTGGGFMWAPDCVYKDGTYYLYFPHKDDSNTWRTGVATSAEPAANFIDRGYIKGLPSGIDPCVFIDDDGQAYFYYKVNRDDAAGQKVVCAVAKLKPNMLELDGDWSVVEGLPDYHEGPWVHKRNGIYYLTYADHNNKGHIHNRLRYAMSDSPMGPWEYKGVVVGGTTEGTQHGSIVEFKGQWYAFYHNNYLSYGKITNGCARSICVDKLFYNEDGTMQLVVQTGLFPEIEAKNDNN